jgi:hypothetical protein
MGADSSTVHAVPWTGRAVTRGGLFAMIGAPWARTPKARSSRWPDFAFGGACNGRGEPAVAPMVTIQFHAVARVGL